MGRKSTDKPWNKRWGRPAVPQAIPPNLEDEDEDDSESEEESITHPFFYLILLGESVAEAYGIIWLTHNGNSEFESQDMSEVAIPFINSVAMIPFIVYFIHLAFRRNVSYFYSQLQLKVIDWILFFAYIGSYIGLVFFNHERRHWKLIISPVFVSITWWTNFIPDLSSTTKLNYEPISNRNGAEGLGLDSLDSGKQNNEAKVNDRERFDEKVRKKNASFVSISLEQEKSHSPFLQRYKYWVEDESRYFVGFIKSIFKMCFMVLVYKTEFGVPLVELWNGTIALFQSSFFVWGFFVTILPIACGWISWLLIGMRYSPLFLQFSLVIIVPVFKAILLYTNMFCTSFLFDSLHKVACTKGTSDDSQILSVLQYIIILRFGLPFFVKKPDATLPLEKDTWARPLYTNACHPLVSILLNRKYVGEEELVDERQISKCIIFLCSQVYREEEEEMLKLLRSYRRVVRSFRNSRVTLEIHLVFDGTTEKMFQEDNPNVKFIHNLSNALNRIRRKLRTDLTQKFNGGDPNEAGRFETKYGWCYLIRHFLDDNDNTKMFIHFKNGELIRKRKRWCQVLCLLIIQERMRLCDKAYLGNRPFDIEGPVIGFYDKEKEDEKIDAHKRVYTLMTDGDIIFKGRDAKLLLDTLERDQRIAGVCGRIRPKGEGLISWFQMFEYDVAQWLQKTAEDVFGSVLCASSCFSMYRLCALESILPDFAMIASNANEFQQFDQGEDRWMCTVLIKNGWSLVSCPNAVARTFCPQDFDTFFIQRRRWVMSTLSNQQRFLLESEHIVKRSESITFLFRFYSSLVLLSSVLNPSVTALVLVGGWQVAFDTSLGWAVFIGLVVPLLYGAFCVWCCPSGSVFFLPRLSEEKKLIALQEKEYLQPAFKEWRQNTQLKVGAWLCGVYAFVVIAAFIGVAVQIAKQPMSPTTFFLIFAASVMIFSAVLHGDSFTLFYGVIYMIGLPAAYIFMMIFVITNADVMDWGTRESSKPTSEFRSPFLVLWDYFVNMVRSCINFCRCLPSKADIEKVYEATQISDVERIRHALVQSDYIPELAIRRIKDEEKERKEKQEKDKKEKDQKETKKEIGNEQEGKDLNNIKQERTYNTIYAPEHFQQQEHVSVRETSQSKISIETLPRNELENKQNQPNVIYDPLPNFDSFYTFGPRLHKLQPQKRKCYIRPSSTLLQKEKPESSSCPKQRTEDENVLALGNANRQRDGLDAKHINIYPLETNEVMMEENKNRSQQQVKEKENEKKKEGGSEDGPLDVFHFRNHVIALFLLVNLSWVTVIIVVTLHSELSILGTNAVGLVSVILFSFLMFIQFVAMVYHRFATFLHEIATTSLDAAVSNVGNKTVRWIFNSPLLLFDYFQKIVVYIDEKLLKCLFCSKCNKSPKKERDEESHYRKF